MEGKERKKEIQEFDYSENLGNHMATFSGHRDLEEPGCV